MSTINLTDDYITLDFLYFNEIYSNNQSNIQNLNDLTTSINSSNTNLISISNNITNLENTIIGAIPINNKDRSII